MGGKHINLRIPMPIYEYLKNEQTVYAYSSVQQVILDALREHCFLHSAKKEDKKDGRGRPKEARLNVLASKERLFSRKGKGPKFKW